MDLHGAANGAWKIYTTYEGLRCPVREKVQLPYEVAESRHKTRARRFSSTIHFGRRPRFPFIGRILITRLSPVLSKQNYTRSCSTSCKEVVEEGAGEAGIPLKERNRGSIKNRW